jgi:hypothetical protein
MFAIGFAKGRKRCGKAMTSRASRGGTHLGGDRDSLLAS